MAKLMDGGPDGYWVDAPDKTVKVDINEIKKDLMKTKEMARLLYYDPSNGSLIYTFNALGKNWVFPIKTVHKTTYNKKISETNEILVEVFVPTIKLADDLKGSRFEPELRASLLIRWIQEAIYNDELH